MSAAASHIGQSLSFTPLPLLSLSPLPITNGVTEGSTDIIQINTLQNASPIPKCFSWAASWQRRTHAPSFPAFPATS